MGRLLIIDDDKILTGMLEKFFTERGFDFMAANEGLAGLEMLKGEKFDLFFLDLSLPDIDGLDVLREAMHMGVSAPAIVITGYGSVKTAVDALKLGAFDYITKPFELDALLMAVKRALKMSTLQEENLMLKRQLKRKYNFPMLIGVSSQIQGVYEMIEKVADTDATVLITGESGTGKERVAKTIHFNSSRGEKPFIPVNCAAIPETLLESELFGHEKGAFTGAIQSRTGRFELANGGTILLDEIAELKPHLQVKLLRVLQEREFERVGGMKSIKVDVRILAATNRNLENAVKEGDFREDLFYRLNVIPLHIPPLRERHDDIPLFIEHFISEFSKAKKKKKRHEPLRVDPDVMKCFLRYNWPGNVRELENMIERVVILNESGTITISDLPERFHQPALNPECKDSISLDGSLNVELPAGGIDLNSVLDDIEKRLVIQAMKKVGGVKSRAAALLGLNRTTLIEKIKKKGLTVEV